MSQLSDEKLTKVCRSLPHLFLYTGQLSGHLGALEGIQLSGQDQWERERVNRNGAVISTAQQCDLLPDL